MTIYCHQGSHNTLALQLRMPPVGVTMPRELLSYLLFLLFLVKEGNALCTVALKGAL